MSGGWVIENTARKPSRGFPDDEPFPYVSDAVDGRQVAIETTVQRAEQVAEIVDGHAVPKPADLETVEWPR